MLNMPAKEVTTILASSGTAHIASTRPSHPFRNLTIT